VGCGPPSPLLSVPNVPITQYITVLLYDDLLLCGFNMVINGLKN